MTQDQYSKLFKYIEAFRFSMDQRFEAVDKKFDAIDNRFDNIDNRMDGVVGQLDDFRTEIAAIDHKTGRLERYTYAIAGKVGIDLDKIKA